MRASIWDIVAQQLDMHSCVFIDKRHVDWASRKLIHAPRCRCMWRWSLLEKLLRRRRRLISSKIKCRRIYPGAISTYMSRSSAVISCEEEERGDWELTLKMIGGLLLALLSDKRRLALGISWYSLQISCSIGRVLEEDMAVVSMAVVSG